MKLFVISYLDYKNSAKTVLKVGKIATLAKKQVLKINKKSPLNGAFLFSGERGTLRQLNIIIENQLVMF